MRLFGIFSNLALFRTPLILNSMSVAEIKATADTLSTSEIGELSRYFRGLALRRNPEYQARLKAAAASQKWATLEELEQALIELEKSGG